MRLSFLLARAWRAIIIRETGLVKCDDCGQLRPIGQPHEIIGCPEIQHSTIGTDYCQHGKALDRFCPACLGEAAREEQA